MAESQLGTPIKVWYEPLPGIAGTRWPILKVKFPNFRQAASALVDSGASISILHPEVAKLLGYSRNKLGKSLLAGKSVSGEYKSWQLPKPLDVEIYGFPFSLKFEVIDNEDLIWPCILGEDSIFQVARLDFQRYKGFFEIKFRKDLN